MCINIVQNELIDLPVTCMQLACTCMYMYMQVFDLLMGDVGKELVDKLQRNTKLFRERMVDAGFTLKVRNIG